jgi:hypothetical protein
MVKKIIPILATIGNLNSSKILITNYFSNLEMEVEDGASLVFSMEEISRSSWLLE